MAITYVSPLKGVSSSNKPIKTNEKYEVDYWYEVEGWGTVSVLNPFIDKISITVPVASSDDQHVIASLLKDVAKDVDEQEYKWGMTKGSPYYQIAINFICQENGEKVLVQAAPKESQPHFLRMEFNPHALSKVGLSAFKAQLSYVTAGALDWSHVVEAGRVTRIDVATDLINARMHDLIIASKTGSKSHFYVGEGGDIETAYVGLTKAQKASDQKGYNKLQEALDHGITPNYDAMVHTRIEITKKAPTQTLIKLEKMGNPFTRISVIHPGKVPDGVDPYLWSIYLDVCRFRGIETATKKLPDDIREICRDAVVTAGKESWNPSSLWKKWPFVLAQSGLLLPN